MPSSASTSERPEILRVRGLARGIAIDKSLFSFVKRRGIREDPASSSPYQSARREFRLLAGIRLLARRAKFTKTSDLPVKF